MFMVYSETLDENEGQLECQEPDISKALWSKEMPHEFVGSETCLVFVIGKLCKEGMSALKAQMKGYHI